MFVPFRSIRKLEENSARFDPVAVKFRMCFFGESLFLGVGGTMRNYNASNCDW